MLKYLVCSAAGGVLALACFPAAPVVAQDATMDEFYGNGVHNFYDRDFFQAMHNLSTAIDGGSRDPRAFYYRGLAKLRSGDSWGAHEDMQMGASLESADVDQFYPVAKSLERVQGSDRATLEKYRALARAQARQRQLRRDAARYEQRRRNEAQVLRAVPVGPPPAPLGVAPAAGVAPAPAAAPPGAVPPAAAPPAAPAEENPFDAPAEAAPAEAPAADDPFATPAAETPAPPTPQPPAAEPPAAAAPAEAPAEENPFADEPK